MNTTLQTLYSDLEKAKNENSDDTIKKTLEFIQTLITERYIEQEKQMIINAWGSTLDDNDDSLTGEAYYENTFGSKRFKIGGIE
jgi:predicted Zn-dependent peptidase